MSRVELLKEYYNNEMNNVFAYSANWLMTVPKKGYENEWEKARIKADILEEMIKELEPVGEEEFSLKE